MSENALSKPQENTKNEPAPDEREGEACLAEIVDNPEELEAVVNNVVRKTVHQLTIQEHRGPLPDPKTLAGYEKIVPGAADRIINMAESEAKHRHSVDDRCIEIDARDSRLGIWFAFILGMTSVIGGLLTIILRADIAGTVGGAFITTLGLGGIIATFVKGTKATWKIERKKEKEPIEK